MAGGETSGGLPLVTASEVFSEEEAICVTWVNGSDTMKDKRIKRERCVEDELQKYICFITILLHHGLIYITIPDSKILSLRMQWMIRYILNS
jgi:hypothetical protein